LSAGVEIRPVIPAGKPESSVQGWQQRSTASLVVSFELHVLVSGFLHPKLE